MCVEMEGGKRGDEAGPSSEKLKELSEKLSEVCDVGEEDDDDDEDHNSNGVGAGFVPGPLVSLKEQIEKDKVLFSFSSKLLEFSLFICVEFGSTLVLLQGFA